MSQISVPASPVQTPRAVLDFRKRLTVLQSVLALQQNAQQNREIERQQNLSEFFQSSSAPPLEIDTILQSSTLLNEVVSSATASQSSSITDIVEGQRLNSIPPDQISVLNDPRSQVRFPDIISTDDYLDDPIKAQGLTEFYPPILTVQVSGSLTQFPRDIAQFVTVITNDPLNPPEVYSVPVTSPLYDRVKVDSFFDREFTEL